LGAKQASSPTGRLSARPSLSLFLSRARLAVHLSHYVRSTRPKHRQTLAPTRSPPLALPLTAAPEAASLPTICLVAVKLPPWALCCGSAGGERARGARAACAPCGCCW